MWHATILMATLASAAPALSVESVEASLKSNGGRATIHRYFGCDNSGLAAYAQVETGSERWLNIAVALLDDSDGCVTVSLTSSIARAIPSGPSRVLNLLNAKPMLTADRICVPFLSEDEDPRKHLRYLRTVEITLESFSEPELRRQRDICLAVVKNAAATITRSLTTRRSGP
jgi:hypothetical protein